MFTKKIFAVTSVCIAMLGSSMATNAETYYHPIDRNAGYGQYANDRNDREAAYRQQQYDRHYRPSQDWKRGQHLSSDYNRDRYAVNDWRDRGLPKPPRGQRWIDVNGEYVLTAIATGVISAILLGSVYGSASDRY